jgi:hypothetical protein
MQERRDAYRGLVEKPQEKRPLGRTGIEGSIILKWVFKNWVTGREMDRCG